MCGDEKFREGVRLFNFIRFLDEARWTPWRDEKDNDSYDVPNYADDKGMTAEQKLLTHFLGYITNRQISYELIFAKLDFIFSQLVCDFKTHSAYYLLLEPGLYFDHENWQFRAHRLMDDQAMYSKDNRLPRNELIMASSRYVPSDFVAIFCTLQVLACITEKKFDAYILKCLRLATPGREMEFLFYGLWLLGYAYIGQWKKGSWGWQEIHKQCLIDKCEDITRFFEGGGIPKKFKRERFSNKRLTCYVRDLLKCTHFRSLFSEIVLPHLPQMLEKLQSQLHVLELPGDVWNNNEYFGGCFCEKTKAFPKTIEPKDKFNVVVRKVYEGAWQEAHLDKNDYYPEQVDTTFDFVRRMCEKNGQVNCKYCPIERGDGKIADEFCIVEQDQSKFCPFLLYACGYKVSCREMKNCPNKMKG